MAQAGTKKGKKAQQLRQLANKKLSAARAMGPQVYSENNQNQEVESKN
jgi:hypothetical protein